MSAPTESSAEFSFDDFFRELSESMAARRSARQLQTIAQCP
jgi:hypothetical protein